MTTKQLSHKKIIIGLTGGFCCGKSTVLRLLKSLGAKTLSCDRVAHEALRKSSPVHKKIVARFGRTILRRSGAIDRRKLGAIVFANASKRKALEQLIHPYVEKRMKTFMATKRGILVIEVPLLFEAKLERLFDRTITVASDERTVMRRAHTKFPTMSDRDIRARMSSQLPPAEKKRRADFVIDNGTLTKTVKQIKALWSTL